MTGREMLVAFARDPHGRPRPGVIVDATPDRLIEIQPSFPIAGPNGVKRIRCGPGRVGDLVREVRAVFAARALPAMWMLDSRTRPADLGEELERVGMEMVDELQVMILPAGAGLPAASPEIDFVDGKGSRQAFAEFERVQRGGFGGGDELPRGDERYAIALQDHGRYWLLATVDGEPAGTGVLTVHADGAMLNGAAVLPRLRGHGVYRALVAERMRRAVEAGAPGVVAQARPTSAPILARLGFEAVDTVRLYLDRG